MRAFRIDGQPYAGYGSANEGLQVSPIFFCMWPGWLSGRLPCVRSHAPTRVSWKRCRNIEALAVRRPRPTEDYRRRTASYHITAGSDYGSSSGSGIAIVTGGILPTSKHQASFLSASFSRRPPFFLSFSFSLHSTPPSPASYS